MASAAARFSVPLVAPKPREKLRPRRSKVIGAKDAVGLWRRRQAVFVDLRDWEVVDETGWIEGAFHCPPGEFLNIVSPTSPLHQRLFQPGKTFIFYGGPKAAPLASAMRARDLGLPGALALRGGLKAWRGAGGRISGHPNSPFPVLKASFDLAAKFARRRLAAWWRGDRRRSAVPPRTD